MLILFVLWHAQGVYALNSKSAGTSVCLILHASVHASGAVSVFLTLCAFYVGVCVCVCVCPSVSRS